MKDQRKDQIRTAQPESSQLDRPPARIAALAVFLCVAFILAWIHREDLFPPAPMASPAADDPVLACFAARRADIDQMLADAVIDEGRASLFKSRAEALCQAQFGQGSGPPPR